MILSPDAAGQIDWSVNTNILAHLPDLPITIVPISWFPNFVFKMPVLSSRWVLVDFMESHSQSDEYDKFWEWVAENPPILTFRRELEKRATSPVVRPIEFTCYLPIPERSERQQFDSRPLEVLYFWGMSHRQRPKLHGDIFREGMANHGIEVISQWDMPIKGGKIWATIYAPYFYRKPMNEVIPWMQQAKITVAMPGNGKKTFRHAECVGTLMAMQDDNLAWAYPWDETNSIRLVPEMDFFSLIEATKRSDLYELYCACDDNMRKYEAHRYANDYVLEEVRKVI
jgi:hypothetical protein